MAKIKKAQLKENMLAANEALLLGSLRQHELAEASDNLSKQLYLLNVKLHSEIAERKQTEAALLASEAQYRALFNSIDEGFCVIEKIDIAPGEPSDFLYVEANPGFEKNTGIGGVAGKTIRGALPQEPQEWFDIYDAILKDGNPAHFERTLDTTGRILELYAFRVEHSLRPRVAVIFRDITGRKQAEVLAQRLAAIVKSSEDAIISTDVDGVITSWNQGAEKLLGYSAIESVGKSVTFLLPPDQRDEESGILERIRNGLHTDPSETVRLRKDGSKVWVSSSVSPLRDARGYVIGASEIIRDMTERRRGDELRDILVSELNHRAKNSLAMVRAIASQTLASATSLETAKLAFDARLGALARGHDLLTHGNWIGTDLESVVKATVEPHGGGDRFRIEGPVVKLTPATALIFTLALHELCTNAAKYGALSKENGHVSVGWQVTGEGAEKRLHLKWTEKDGPPVIPPQRKGFGSRLIEKALAMELSGEVRIDYEVSGVVCTIVAPLPEGKEKV
jgi:PAS domain S-box-containing protein